MGRGAMAAAVVGLLAAAGVVAVAQKPCSRALDRWVAHRALELAQGRQEWLNTWLGVPIIQFPEDLWTYQLLIERTRPDFVIETGTCRGGLSLYLAGVLEALGGEGKVITVDLNPVHWNETLRTANVRPGLLERIIFLEGDSVSEEVLDQIAARVEGKRVLVILDSLHTKGHVLRELELYSAFVAPSGYIVVNDTHLDRVSATRHQPGPKAAVLEFLKGRGDFELDHSVDRFMISCFHSGILRRKR